MAKSAKAQVPAAESVVCVGRQAILDRESQVVAYELLYRGARSANGEPFDELAATAHVLVNTVANLGIESVVGSHTMYVNCTQDVLDLPLHELLPAEQVVLEVLERVEVTDALAARMVELRELGFRVALDDWVANDPRWEVMEYADVIKVDVFGLSAAEVAKVLAGMQSFKGLRLAEKVETASQYEACKKQGFDLFQGFYFCRPDVLSQKSGSSEAMNLLRVLGGLQRPGITMEEAAGVVEQDVVMSYKLLKCLNSASVGLRQTVNSVRHGLVLLGVPRVRAWVQIMGICSITTNKPDELLRLSVMRASLCRSLAEGRKGVDQDSMGMVGMFSLLDVLLDMPMEQILAQLPLSKEVAGILMGEPSAGADVLRAVRAYERGDFQVCEELGFDLTVLGREWLQASSNADQIVETMQKL